MCLCIINKPYKRPGGLTVALKEEFEKEVCLISRKELNGFCSRCEKDCYESLECYIDWLEKKIKHFNYWYKEY